MKKRTMTARQLAEAYAVLSQAKYAALEDADKIKLFRTTRALKSVAEEYDDACKDAGEKMKFEGFDDKLQKARDYERTVRDGGTSAVTAEEYGEISRQFGNYNKLVSDALKELGSREHEVEVEPLGEEAFTKLMGGNDWTVAQAMAASEAVTDGGTSGKTDGGQG